MLDPDPEMGGGVVTQTLNEEGGVAKNFFLALLASVWSKKKGGPRPSPWICHCALRLNQYLTLFD